MNKISENKNGAIKGLKGALPGKFTIITKSYC